MTPERKRQVGELVLEIISQMENIVHEHAYDPDANQSRLSESRKRIVELAVEVLEKEEGDADRA